MSRDWYARKFGQPQPPRTPQPEQQAAQWPQGQQQQGLQPLFQGQQNDPEAAGRAALARGDYAEAAQYWQGGEGTRTETEKCPNCGSANYFGRQNRPAPGVNVGGGATGRLITQNGQMTVAARCFDCNYNGLFDLQG